MSYETERYFLKLSAIKKKQISTKLRTGKTKLFCDIYRKSHKVLELGTGYAATNVEKIIIKKFIK